MKKRGFLFVITMVMLLVCTVGIGFSNKSEAKACNYFKRISLKKCVVTLDEQEYFWTGQECKPEVTITYGETTLVKDVDYQVQYKRNIDAGQATVVVKGIGDYRSKIKTKFRIKGLDFAKNCDVILDDANRTVKVYFRGKPVDESFYGSYFLENKQVLQKHEGPHGVYYVYNVTRTYVVSGKGPFEGTVTKEYTRVENEYIPN